jgi:heptosyltransferase-1
MILASIARPRTGNQRPTESAPLEKSSFKMKMLVIKPSSLGDVVQALPVLRVLREKYPRARIDWLVNEEIGGILTDNPYLETIHLWDRAGWSKPARLPAAFKKAASVIRHLRQARYDAVLDLQGLLRSGLIARLSRAKEIIGFADAREMAPLFYSRKVHAPTNRMHSVERYVLAAGGDPSQEMRFPIAFSKQDRQTVEDLLARMRHDKRRPFIVFAPAARWETKRWPEKNYAALAEILHASDVAHVGLVGSHAEIASAKRIASMGTCPLISFTGRTTLKQLAYLLKKADAVVGNDTGPIHIAAAMGTPVVALYGPTSPTRTGPYGKQHTVLTSGLPCSPCFSRKCDLGVLCMREISVETVYRACKPYLIEAKGKAE